MSEVIVWVKFSVEQEAGGQAQYLLGSIAHAQHAIGKMAIISKSAMTPKKFLVVPSFQKLLQYVIPIQT